MASQICQCLNPSPSSLLNDLQPIDLTSAVHCPRGLSLADETELLTTIRLKQGKDRKASLLTLFSAYAQVLVLILERYRQWCLDHHFRYDEKRLTKAAEKGFNRMVDEHQLGGNCVDFKNCAIESMRRSMLYTLLGEASS